MPKFSIEVPSDWPTVWPAANLSPGQWLRVELADNGDLIDLSHEASVLGADEFNALLDHVGIGARGEGAQSGGAIPSTEAEPKPEQWVAHVEPIENVESLIGTFYYCYHCDVPEADHKNEGCSDFKRVASVRIRSGLIDPLLKAVAEVAAERPDYIYPRIDGCDYIRVEGVGMATRCVIGEALHRLGVSDLTLEAMDHAPDPGISTFLYSGAPAAHALAKVQQAQDTGTPWGELPALIYGELAKRKG